MRDAFQGPMHREASSAPPPPPERLAKLRFSFAQRIGLPVLLVIPALALAGWFGPVSTVGRATHGALDVVIESPNRLHYRQRAIMTVSVHNQGQHPLDDVRLRADTAWLRAFSNATFSPALSGDGTVHLGPLPAGETGHVVFAGEGEHAGRHAGALTVSAESADTVRLPLELTIFP